MKHWKLLFLIITTCAAAQDSITVRDIESAEKLIGLKFNDAKRESLLGDVQGQLNSYRNLRAVPIPNSVVPSTMFNPIPFGTTFEKKSSLFSPEGRQNVVVPKNSDELAFLSVSELSTLIKNRKITSEQLTKLYLERIEKYRPLLQCIVTVTDSLALAQARRADKEIAAGKYRGPLHGIPYGAKDLLATKKISHNVGIGSVQTTDDR